MCLIVCLICCLQTGASEVPAKVNNFDPQPPDDDAAFAEAPSATSYNLATLVVSHVLCSARTQCLGHVRTRGRTLHIHHTSNCVF